MSGRGLFLIVLLMITGRPLRTHSVQLPIELVCREKVRTEMIFWGDGNVKT